MNIEGQVFSKLTAKKFKHTDKNGQSFYLFQCECGAEKTLRASNVVNGSTRSCGCSYRSHNNKPTGEAAFNKLLYMYKVNAKRRNLSFSISKKKFKTLTKMPCEYCGVGPMQCAYQYFQGGRSTPYMFNGIDRIVNTKGYIPSNVVTCCTICNYAKRSLSLAEFLAWIDRLVKFRN